MSNSTAQDVFFLANLQNSRPLVDDFARRLVTLRLIQRHKRCFSRQLCALSRPLVDNLAPVGRQGVELATF